MRQYLRTDGGSGKRDPQPSAAPSFALLLVSSERGQQWIACACERAEARGVRVGMSLAHAKALLRGTEVRERPFTPTEDAARLHRLAQWALRFSPVVAADEPDGLLFDVAGCEHLFGGEERMVALVDSSLAQWGLAARLALAPTVGCAWAMARFAEHRITIVGPDRIGAELAPLPTAGLRIDPAFVVALREVGIERIGTLLDVPRAELACRFGADLLRRVDQALGHAIETITPIRPVVPLEVTRVFDGPVLNLEAITITVRELLFALVLQLEERGCGVNTLEISLQRIAAEPCRWSITLTHPSRDFRHLWTLIRPKVERTNLGYGVESISLCASRFGRLAVKQLSLPSAERKNGDAENGAVLGAFLDRLMDRLGARNVMTLSAVATHVPEEAFLLRAWSQAPKQGSHGDETMNGMVHADRPSLLFATPERVQVISLVPDGPPSWLHWRGRGWGVHCGYGPERIALPWWESQRGGAPSPDIIRDYYEVQDDQGRLLWVFRDHVTHDWFVHGLWA